MKNFFQPHIGPLSQVNIFSDLSLLGANKSYLISPFQITIHELVPLLMMLMVSLIVVAIRCRGSHTEMAWVERSARVLCPFTLALLFTPSAHGSEDDLYDFLWLDPDKKVYVLQNKVFAKKGTQYINASFLQNTTTDFQDNLGYMLRGGHYFTEEWGVEAVFSQLSYSDDDTFGAITSVNGTVPFVRRINSYYGGMVTWSPFYGKINTFNKIYYFDVSFGAGAAKMQAETNREDFNNLSNSSNYTREDYNAAMWKAEVRLHLNENWHIGLGAINLHYKAKGARNDSKNKWRRHTDGFIGVGFSF